MQAEGLIMEYFLSNKVNASNLKESVDLYCQEYNVPDSVKTIMHNIRKNRNIAAHGLNKGIEAVDYTSSESRKYQIYYYNRKNKPQKNYTIKNNAGKLTLEVGNKLIDIKPCKYGYACHNPTCQYFSSR